MAILSRKSANASPNLQIHFTNKPQRQTNSSKPAFVFWALIALPTLTVLIGAIGDVVAEFVNWYTDWIGTHTQSIYQIFKALTAKANKTAKVKDAARKTVDPEKDPNGLPQPEDKEQNTAGFDQIASIESRRTVPLDFKMDGLTALQAAVAEETYRPFVMLRAAQHIMGHLDVSPPKKYTFKEWSWLLKLMGEDEAETRGHRRVGQALKVGQEVVTPARLHAYQVWSWLGQESPLMSLEEGEAPCIFEHLVITSQSLS